MTAQVARKVKGIYGEVYAVLQGVLWEGGSATKLVGGVFRMVQRVFETVVEMERTFLSRELARVRKAVIYVAFLLNFQIKSYKFCSLIASMSCPFLEVKVVLLFVRAMNATIELIKLENEVIVMFLTTSYTDVFDSVLFLHHVLVALVLTKLLCVSLWCAIDLTM